jgi:hypothetical protein
MVFVFILRLADGSHAVCGGEEKKIVQNKQTL